jgi:hypothetical protein
MKLMLRYLLQIVFLSSVTSLTLDAQNYVEIGSGTVQNSMPIYSSWNYSWSSLIYNHSDLGTAKTITKIGLNCTNGPKTVTNQKIYVKLSSNTIFANANYEDPLNNGYLLVYQGNITFQTGWNEIVLSTPIAYDGTQNLVIHWENRWGTSYGPQFNSTTTSINNNKNCGSDASFPNPSQVGYLNPYPSSLTNMRFYYASSGPATPGLPFPADNAAAVSVDTDLSWTIGSNTTNYDLYFGTNPQNLTMVVNNASCTAGVYSYTVPGLLGDSLMHYWKVIAKNGTQTEASPIWKFKTEVVIDQFPFSEGFEDSLVFNSFPITSAWKTLPEYSWYQYDANRHSGLFCAKSYSSIAGNSAILLSPKVLLPPGHSITYYWRNTSVNKIAGHDTTFFEISINGGNNWIKIDTLAPLTPNATYIQRTHSLNAYSGNNFFFRFRHKTDNSSSGCNTYLDDISIFQSGATPTLLVTPTNQNVTAPAGNTSFTVTSNSTWTAMSNQAWCTVTPSGTGNGAITATFTQNTGVQRIANVTVSVTGLTPVTVTVTQAAQEATLSVSPSNQNVSSLAGNTSFTVTSNSSWTAISNQTWCSVTPSGNGNATISATYTENATGTQRIASITVTVNGINPVVITVTQGTPSASLSVTPANQDVSFAAGNVNYSVLSNSSWTATSDKAWCTVTQSGNGNGSITANYLANTELTNRVANITITVAGLTPVIVTLTQAASPAFISATPGNQNVAYQSGTTNFSINSNSAWTAISDAGWCAVTASGTGNGTLFANYAENVIATVRIAHITISVAGLNPVLVTITQLGPNATLSINPLIQNVAYQAGVTSFAVTSNVNWTATSDASWCQPTSSGTGSITLSAAYSLNNTMGARTANITVNADNVSPVIVQVIQQPSFVEITEFEASAIEIFPNPASEKINIIIPKVEIGATLILYNIEGVKVIEQKISDPAFYINVRGLIKGNYLLKIINGNLISDKKIVII